MTTNATSTTEYDINDYDLDTSTLDERVSMAITFVFTGTKVTRRTLWTEPEDIIRITELLILAQDWADSKKGRKAQAFSPGHFSTTLVPHLLRLWLPKHKAAVHQALCSDPDVR